MFLWQYMGDTHGCDPHGNIAIAPHAGVCVCVRARGHACVHVCACVAESNVASCFISTILLVGRRSAATAAVLLLTPHPHRGGKRVDLQEWADTPSLREQLCPAVFYGCQTYQFCLEALFFSGVQLDGICEQTCAQTGAWISGLTGANLRPIDSVSTPTPNTRMPFDIRADMTIHYVQTC